MKHTICRLAILLMLPFSLARGESVSSPSGNIRFSVEVTPALVCRVEAYGKTVVAPSAVAFDFAGQPGLGERVRIAKRRSAPGANTPIGDPSGQS